MQNPNAFALTLLDFIEQSVTEAIGNASDRAVLLSEADDAMRVLKRTLRKNDQFRYAAFVLGHDHRSFEFTAANNPTSEERALRMELQQLLEARIIFQAEYGSEE